MKRSLWPTRDSVKDYFPLPKEIFSLGLSAAEIAIYASPSDQFNSCSNRTMTDRYRSWTRTRQDENMPILFKTQVKRTAKTRLPRRRAHVGGLCGFRGTVERVPARSPKTGRCADVRERCGNGKRRRREPAGGFRQREKP